MQVGEVFVAGNNDSSDMVLRCVVTYDYEYIDNHIYGCSQCSC